MSDPCPQCGLLHPALSLDEKCPLAKNKTSEGELVDSSAFVNQLKNIVISKIQSKKIKDHKKLFSAVLVEIFRFLDHYKEE